MASSKYIGILLKIFFNKGIFLVIALVSFCNLNGALSNLTRNDPFPYFSTAYPYNYLSLRERIVFEKIGTSCFEEERFQASATPFTQWANRGINFFKENSPLGDIPQRTNTLALFYDPFLRNKLADILGFTPAEKQSQCFTNVISSPHNSDPRREFGFFSMPLTYNKTGVRFEFLLKLWENCFDAVGLKIQFGVAEIRQSVPGFNDLSCQALGLGCPVYNNTQSPSVQTSGAPCGTSCPTCSTITTITGGVEYQIINPPTVGCCNAKCCVFSFNCECKKLVIERIMNQFYKIARYLDYDIGNFYDTKAEDLRFLLWWREIIEINAVDPFWPRVLFIPFLEVGAAAPLTKHKDPRALFALPFGNNGHSSAGITGGMAFDFIDILEISASAGITKFFKQEICGFPLPTHELESVIYPYKADITIEPGHNSHFALTLNARHFLGRLSVWFQYLGVSHAEDDIRVCRSLIPLESDYFSHNLTDPERISPSLLSDSDLARRTLQQGFLVNKAEELTKWETHMFNIAFNYDISPNVILGVLYQHTFSYDTIFQRRNVYCSDMLMFSAIAHF